MFRAVIEGSSGYAGMELTRILSRHPEIQMVGLTSTRWSGSTPRERLGLAGAGASLKYAPAVEVEAEVVFLATPAEESLKLAARWQGRGARIVDLSNAFRDQVDVVYGLTEHFRESVRGAALVANPGCYPTASLLAMLPLVRAGLVGRGPVCIDAKSGVTGAGRKLADDYLFSELAQNAYPYRVGSHQHEPEIERFLEKPLLFTPHLLPTRRGLIIAAYFSVADGVTVQNLSECLEASYRNEPFVQVVECGAALGIGEVIHTPNCRVAVAPVIKEGMARVFGSLDNLLKGAASQAVQNLNLMLGLPETAGLI